MSVSALRTAAPALAAYALYSVSFGLTVSAFPLLLATHSADLRAAALSFGAAGLLKHCLEAAASPLLGALSDAAGRRPLLLLGLACASALLSLHLLCYAMPCSDDALCAQPRRRCWWRPCPRWPRCC